jgi:hypothetical protein
VKLFVWQLLGSRKPGLLLIFDVQEPGKPVKDDVTGLLTEEGELTWR